MANEDRAEVLQGTLDLMILQTLDSMGPQHGYGIARRIEQVTGNAILLHQGTIYASLVRLVQRGWIKSHWGTSDTTRRAKYYELTRTGRLRLQDDADYWRKLSVIMGRVLDAPDN